MNPSTEPMSEAMYYILLALHKPMHGYAIIHAVREMTGGVTELSSGTLYGVLTRLEIGKMITLTGVEGRKKLYVITDVGRMALMAECDRLHRMLRSTHQYILGGNTAFENENTEK